jgi:hypothetical protein
MRPMTRAYRIFSPHQARTVVAAAERIFPADELGPGATEIGVVDYVDAAVAGDRAGLGDLYRRGVERLDAEARARAGVAFADAPAEVQDVVLAELEGTPFFEALLQHTREGLFADPVHGGNRDMLGWRLLGHPGAQRGYGPDAHLPDARIERAPSGLREWLLE